MYQLHFSKKVKNKFSIASILIDGPSLIYCWSNDEDYDKTFTYIYNYNRFWNTQSYATTNINGNDLKKNDDDDKHKMEVTSNEEG